MLQCWNDQLWSKVCEDVVKNVLLMHWVAVFFLPFSTRKNNPKEHILIKLFLFLLVLLLLKLNKIQTLDKFFIINPFLLNEPFWFPSKHQKTFGFLMFWGESKRKIGKNGLILNMQWLLGLVVLIRRALEFCQTSMKELFGAESQRILAGNCSPENLRHRCLTGS